MRKGSLAGRLTAAGKRSLADSFGGTPESFAAIDRGLAWLARQQKPNGSWVFDGTSSGDTIAATGMGTVTSASDGVFASALRRVTGATRGSPVTLAIRSATAMPSVW
jgi:hypothetical protein